MTTAARPAVGPARQVARIGPNAIIQVVTAIEARWGAAVADEMLAASTPYTRGTLPSDMVDEREPLALVRALLAQAGNDASSSVLHDAGVRTAHYLLAHRIPRAAQLVIRALPRRLGLALLLRAIGAHAWTFAGSGQFTVAWVHGWPVLRFTDCAMCRGMSVAQPMCHYYAGTFETLFRVLVARDIRVREVACQAQGAAWCEFVVGSG